MNKALFKPILYFIYWIIFSVAARGLFLTYHHTKTATLNFTETVQSFVYGLHLDASFAAYVSIIPFCCFFLNSLTNRFQLYHLIKWYTLILVTFLSLLIIIDLGLYQAWGFRLDITPLQYLNTPSELIASISAAPLFLLTVISLLFAGMLGLIYLNLFQPYFTSGTEKIILIRTKVLIFLYLPLLIIPIRGWSWHIPLNQSNVYFSNKLFANHAAVNLPWNVMYSLNSSVIVTTNPYQYLQMPQAREYVADLYQSSDINQDSTHSVLKIKRPNILFIILESYTAKLVGCLGGEPGVTPNIDSLSREGLLFSNIYASGDRSEKGLVALLSGYPVQTTASIVKMPRKTEKLPHLNKVFKAQGYHSSYYYGGELAFANIKSYLLNAGYDRLVSKFDFAPETYNSKWGVHDHVLLNRLFNDLQSEPQPFFSTLFTLSSHEPYEIPIPAKFSGSDEATLFKNSVFYTDKALGDFIRKAKKQAWWQNTLIIMAADHGHRFPGDNPIDAPGKFHIPVLFTGGALKQGYPPVTSIGSQTDLVPTLLHQLGLPAKQFKWGKNLLSPGARQFAFYTFIDGFGFVTPAGTITFDNVSKRVISRSPGIPEQQLNFGKAYMQLSFDDYLKK